MKRLNKCRTLAEFNEAILRQTLGLQPQDSSQSTNQQSTNKDKANETQANEKTNQKDGKVNTSENQINSTTDKEKNEAANNTNLTSEQLSSQYLYFGADEFIITTYKMETGWWYGYKDIGETNPSNIKFGYFPSNYVQVIEEFPEEVVNPVTEETKNTDENDPFGGVQVSWADYANSSYLNEAQLVMEERLKKMVDPLSTDNKNQEGVLRYKKIKIHESRSHAVNPWKGGKVTYGQVPVRDQTHVGKAYRQMAHYFDYDKWIDERNANPTPKAKADPTKKKKKKIPDWLAKLGTD